MRAPVALVLAFVLAGCASAAPATNTPPPIVTPSPSPTPSPEPSAAAGRLIGESLAGLQAELAALGFAVASIQGETPGVEGRMEGGGTIMLFGDPVILVGWQVTEPFLDNGPLRALLESRGLGDVGRWMDDNLWRLEEAGTNARADTVVDDLPVLLMVQRSDDGMTIGVLLGEVGWLPGWDDATPKPTDAAWPAELPAAMDAYADLATAVNGRLVRDLAVLRDPSAKLELRRQAATRGADAETAFAAGLGALAFPGDLDVGAGILAQASEEAARAFAAASKATSAAAMETAVAEVLVALEAAAAVAEAFRGDLLSYGLLTDRLSIATPPSIAAGAVVPAPGALEKMGHSYSLDGGVGEITVFVQNPTSAFAIGAVIEVRIIGEQGGLLATTTLEIPAIGPGQMLGAIGGIDARNPAGESVASAEVEVRSVGEWRAAAEAAILGR
jgi:hypothetical protein